MVCCVMPAECSHSSALGSWMALDHHQKRSAASYNEIGSFITHSVQKKIRMTLEPIPLLVAAQKIQQQQVQAYQSCQANACPKREVQQTGQQASAIRSSGPGAERSAHAKAHPIYTTNGYFQPSITQAFHLYSECEQEFLQDCLAKEIKSQANHQYFHTTQCEIDAHKRLVLVDWLIEVVDEFGLSQETLYLSISLLDRFLSLQAVPRCQLQLLGVTCLWVASKYEEVLPPVLQDFVEITDNSYSGSDLVRMEALLLSSLDYELAVPTSLHFLHQLLSHAQLESGNMSPGGPCSPDCPSEARLAHMAEYLLELALLTPDTLRYRPSVVAASALQLAANYAAASCEPSSRLAYINVCHAISTAAATQLDSCMEELRRMYRWAGSAVSPPCVRDKYSDVKHSCVAIMGQTG